MTQIDFRPILFALGILKTRSDSDSRNTRAGILKKPICGKGYFYHTNTPVLFRPKTDSFNIIVVTFPLPIEDLKKNSFGYEPVVKDFSVDLDKNFVTEIVLE